MRNDLHLMYMTRASYASHAHDSRLADNIFNQLNSLYYGGLSQFQQSMLFQTATWKSTIPLLSGYIHGNQWKQEVKIPIVICDGLTPYCVLWWEIHLFLKSILQKALTHCGDWAFPGLSRKAYWKAIPSTFSWEASAELSKNVRYSIPLCSAKCERVVPFTVTLMPVAGIPLKVAVWVPVKVQRVTTECVA